MIKSDKLRSRLVLLVRWEGNCVGTGDVPIIFDCIDCPGRIQIVCEYFITLPDQTATVSKNDPKYKPKPAVRAEALKILMENYTKDELVEIFI